MSNVWAWALADLMRFLMRLHGISGRPQASSVCQCVIRSNVVHAQFGGSMFAISALCATAVDVHRAPRLIAPLQVELEGMREAHLRDAVALSDLLSFLEREVSRCCSAVGLHAPTSLQSGHAD